MENGVKKICHEGKLITQDAWNSICKGTKYVAGKAVNATNYVADGTKNAYNNAKDTVTGWIPGKKDSQPPPPVDPSAATVPNSSL